MHSFPGRSARWKFEPRLLSPVILFGGRLTDDQRYIDAIVEGQAGEEPAQREGPEGARARGCDGGQERDDVAQHQRGDSPSVVGDPAEEEAADDRAAEEDRLCR